MNPRRTAPKSRRATPQPRRTPPPRKVPILSAADARTIVTEMAMTLAPDDLAELAKREPELRAEIAELDIAKLPLLREQLTLALDCLCDHVEGECSQIPYYAVVILAAGVSYFADEFDVIPDFLPGVGRLDDGLIMATAFQLARHGVQRYCDWKSRPVPGSVTGTTPTVPRGKRR